MDKEYYEGFEERLKEVFADRPEPEITVADLLTLLGYGIIGKIEFRNWLAELFPSFSRARRADLDALLERQGEEAEAEDQLELELDEDDDQLNIRA